MAPRRTFEVASAGLIAPSRTFEVASAGLIAPSRTFEVASAGLIAPRRILEATTATLWFDMLAALFIQVTEQNLRGCPFRWASYRRRPAYLRVNDVKTALIRSMNDELTFANDADRFYLPAIHLVHISVP